MLIFNKIKFLILVGLLVLASSKWTIYRLSAMAILQYYGELGLELPSLDTIQKYRIKVAKKEFGLE